MLELKPGTVNFALCIHEDHCPTSASGDAGECCCAPRLEIVEESHFSTVVVRDRKARREAEREAAKALAKARRRH